MKEGGAETKMKEDIWRTCRETGFKNGPGFHQFPGVVCEEASLYKIKLFKEGKSAWVSAHGRL